MTALPTLFYRRRPLLVLAPMAGVTDLPFRELSLTLGADMAVSEMVKAGASLQGRAGLRSLFAAGDSPRSVQIIGNQPTQMAEAARLHQDMGADLIDINMGCPAKKFGKKPAGSALLAEPTRVAAILRAVVAAVDIPATLKIRTGIDSDHRNALEIGHIAEAEGIQALAVHGRTRQQKFSGDAEHDTAAALVDALDIPIFANGDIDSPERAARVLESTGAAGLLIGRAARRNPWIFGQIRHYLDTGSQLPAPGPADMNRILQQQLRRINEHYDGPQALLIATRQLGWCVAGWPGANEFRHKLALAISQQQQSDMLQAFFSV